MKKKQDISIFNSEGLASLIFCTILNFNQVEVQTMSVLDENVAIFKYFEEISKIPHGSFHEEKIADYVENFAKEHNFKYVRDNMNNVIIYKNATPGYENHDTVMLQAHMDMVCEKNKDVNFDFETDALNLYVEDGWLKAKGTTLGADDGFGVSYMLAILSDDTLKHPNLECVFTVQEEVGLLGSINLKKEYFNAKKMIGLDEVVKLALAPQQAVVAMPMSIKHVLLKK